MNIEIKKLPKSQLELTVTIPAEKWDAYYKRATDHLAQHVNIPGFRPGKVNAKMLEQQLGTEEIYNEVANIAVNDTFYAAAKEKEVTPIGQPKIDLIKIAPENDIIYKAIFSVLPKISLPEYKEKIKSTGLKMNEVKVEEKEITESIDYILNSRSKAVAVQRPAQKGDRIEIDFVTRIDGVKIENGESKNHPLIISKSHFLPEFEAQVTGMKAGEEKVFDIVYPANYHHKQMAGKKVNFTVKLIVVQEISKPEFTDEFAKTLGNFDNKEALKKSISEGIATEKTKKEKSEFRIKIVEALIKNYASDELPEILIEAEKDRMLAEFKYNVESNGLKFEDYLKQLKKTEEILKKDWETPAKNRINSYLINYEIARNEDIKVDETEISEEANKIMSSYADVPDAQKNIDLDKLKSNVHDFLLNEKVLTYLELVALGKDKPVPKT